VLGRRSAPAGKGVNGDRWRGAAPAGPEGRPSGVTAGPWRGAGTRRKALHARSDTIHGRPRPEPARVGMLASSEDVPSGAKHMPTLAAGICLGGIALLTLPDLGAPPREAEQTGSARLVVGPDIRL